MITLYNSFPDDFRMEEPLFVEIDKLAVPLFCSEWERRGQSGAVARFDDIDTERRAEEFLVGREIFIEEEADDDDDKVPTGQTYISKSKAKSLALKKAGLSSATFQSVELDEDDDDEFDIRTIKEDEEV